MGEHPLQINALLDQVFTYGPFWVYLAIFAACFFENIFPPFPGDSFIIAAGGLVALGRLDLVMSLVLIVTSGMSSVMLLYLVGRRFGRSYFVCRNFKYFSTADIARMEERFSRWGAVILIGSRFIVGMRSVLAVVAGISRYSAWRMTIFSTLSYVMFCALLFFAAFKLVENLETIEYYIRTYNRIVVTLVTILVVLWIVRKVRTRRKESR
jgi:membrane protein DedA with SNARE-associated domain